MHSSSSRHLAPHKSEALHGYEACLGSDLACSLRALSSGRHIASPDSPIGEREGPPIPGT